MKPVKFTNERKETDIQAQALEYLELRGCFVWRNNSGKAWSPSGRPFRFGKTGSPDVIGVMPGGRFIGVELKKPRKKPTEKQREFHEELAKRGALVIVATSLADLAEQYALAI